MNRTIKFRAWDNARKEMIATGFHVIGEVTMFSVIEQYLSENKIEGKLILERLTDVVISQFTGLHDCEGKEIYEGDIIEIEKGFSNSVIFYNGSFVLNNSFWYIGGIASKHIKIIGNIYENSDLIS